MLEERIGIALCRVDHVDRQRQGKIAELDRHGGLVGKRQGQVQPVGFESDTARDGDAGREKVARLQPAFGLPDVLGLQRARFEALPRAIRDAVGPGGIPETCARMDEISRYGLRCAGETGHTPAVEAELEGFIAT